MLIAGRAVAGAAASVLFTGGMLMIEAAVPLSERPVYIAAISAMFGLSALLGPILGGVLTQNLSWRWCFWINLPIGFAAFVGIMPLRLTSLPKKCTSPLRRVLDIGVGSATVLTACLLCLLLALQNGGTTFHWQNGRIVGLFCSCFCLLVAFVAIQIYYGNDSLIPIKLLRQRTVLVSSCFTFFLSMATFT